MISKGRRIGMATVATLALLLLLALSTTTAGAAMTTVKVDPATQEVMAGDPFSVNVTVENVVHMGADQARLNFDPTAMTATGITEGDFLKTGGATIGAGMEDIDNVNGSVTFFYALTTQGAGVNGSGTLATIDFTANPAAAGVYPLNLTDVMLADGHGYVITVDGISNGTVVIKAGAPPAAVPGLSGTGFVVAIGLLAVVLAISVSAKRRLRK